jgi:hypothetical protein
MKCRDSDSTSCGVLVSCSNTSLLWPNLPYLASPHVYTNPDSAHPHTAPLHMSARRCRCARCRPQARGEKKRDGGNAGTHARTHARTGDDGGVQRTARDLTHDHVLHSAPHRTVKGSIDTTTPHRTAPCPYDAPRGREGGSRRGVPAAQRAGWQRTSFGRAAAYAPIDPRNQHYGGRRRNTNTQQIPPRSPSLPPVLARARCTYPHVNRYVPPLLPVFTSARHTHNTTKRDEARTEMTAADGRSKVAYCGRPCP